ncbi:MAG: protein kinase [Myxococcaceae bacterium]|nr:protein kinase [Myxococcaceae bacterium]MCI0672475.1 protein kinase [Myxococcaceae bacterium]
MAGRDARDLFEGVVELEGSADPLVGRVLNGRFDIQEPIGEGGMGKVYRAIQTPLGRPVAVKVLNPNLPSSQDPNFQRRFLQEAALTARLHHPNTVTVIDYGQSEDGIYFLAMEYLEGRTLAEVLGKSGPLSWPRVVNIAQQICRSLKEAHAQGVVHRDLKPANIMLSSEGDEDLVKVLDFGLVKTLTGDVGQAMPDITQRGTFIGSPQYMSPEQARNEADARSDVYSLGVLLFHMLVGRPPFVSSDYIELLFAHHRQQPPQFKQLRPDLDIPAVLESVVRRCLEKAPEARFQGMDEVLDALRQAAQAAGANSGLFRSPASSGVFKQPVAPSGPLFSSISSNKKPADDAAAMHEATEPTRPFSSVSESGVRQQQKLGAQGAGPSKAVIGAAVGVLVLLGVGAVWVLRSGPSAPEVGATAPVAAAETAPAPEAAPAAPEGPAPTVEVIPEGTASVKFRVMSDPVGARVVFKGKEKGRTPFVMEVPAGSEGLATVELTFLADGYLPETVLSGGSGDVVVMAKLQKRGSPPRRDKERTFNEPAPAAAAPVVAQQPAPLPAAATPAPTAAAPSAAPALPPATAQAQVALASRAASEALMTTASATKAEVRRVNGEDVYAFGDGMEPPVKLEGNAPVYSRSARTAGVSGNMIVKCTINTQGRVSNCRVLKTLPFMEEAVVTALTTSLYRPARFNGKPVAVDYVFNYRLQAPR